MAAQIGILVSALKQWAVNAGNPVALLSDIVNQRFTRETAGNGRIVISTSSGGSAASFSLLPGFTDGDMIQSAHLALRVVQSGVDAPVVFGPNGPSMLPAIQQQLNSERTTSYAQFGNIQH